MKRFAIWLLATVAVLGYCRAEVTKLRSEDRKVLQDTSRFYEVHYTTNLPPAVIRLCTGEGGTGMAEPGQKWQAGCVGDGKFMRRLIWGVTAGDYHVVHYESGGFAHGYHVVLATSKQGETKATMVWHGIGKQLKNYAALLRAIEQNELDDTLHYIP